MTQTQIPEEVVGEYGDLFSTEVCGQGVAFLTMVLEEMVLLFEEPFTVPGMALRGQARGGKNEKSAAYMYIARVMGEDVAAWYVRTTLEPSAIYGIELIPKWLTAQHDKV